MSVNPVPYALELDNLTKSYPSAGVPALHACTLSVAAGELLAVLGPSGCGKTTLLRLIAGFEKPDAGSIFLHGRVVAGERWLEPEARGIGFVFQDYALFPHLTVTQNVAFGLPHLASRARQARTAEILNLVGLTVFAARYPHQLSGGQQQRVALARALAPGPQLILLDEPFSNLDAALRTSTRKDVRSLLKAAGVTAILVTHDQEEALTFADHLVLMRAGQFEQEGSPEEVYTRPRTTFSASFLGVTNLLQGEAQGSSALTPLGALPLSRCATGPVLLSLRPEDIVFAEAGLRSRVLVREFKGRELTFACESVGGTGKPLHLTVQTGASCTAQPGDEVFLSPSGCGVPLEPAS